MKIPQFPKIKKVDKPKLTRLQRAQDRCYKGLRKLPPTATPCFCADCFYLEYCPHKTTE